MSRTDQSGIPAPADPRGEKPASVVIGSPSPGVITYPSPAIPILPNPTARLVRSPVRSHVRMPDISVLRHAGPCTGSIQILGAIHAGTNVSGTDRLHDG